MPAIFYGKVKTPRLAVVGRGGGLLPRSGDYKLDVMVFLSKVQFKASMLDPSQSLNRRSYFNMSDKYRWSNPGCAGDFCDTPRAFVCLEDNRVLQNSAVTDLEGVLELSFEGLAHIARSNFVTWDD